MNNSYHTLAQPTEGFYKEKGSKFLAFAFPVLSEEEVKQSLEKLRQEYSDARHHCYAYILGANQEHYRAYDDGEPNNSAGTPILNQIRSFGLSNVLVVVIRYFGGTKLGISGLVSAYKSAAQEALEQGEIIEKVLQSRVVIEYPYAQTSRVKQLIQQFNMEIISQDFAEACQARLSFATTDLEILKVTLEDEPLLLYKF
jgi:uncharacterized YigZ family protein